jgi:L-amino acid N-acyltransferase YncA
MKRPQYNHFVPRIPCFLRPAQMFDMDAVRLIYNWEVQHGLQALDCHPLSTEDFEKLLATAQAQDTPFIVAVRGSARELGLTKGTLIYSVFQQMPFREANRRGEVLGFALLSPWQSGLAVGSASGTGGNSTPTARIHVYVRPDSRRHKIGFSLLDMLLTSVSDRFSSQSGYDFVDPDGGPAYKSSSGAERRYFHLYLSYLVRHQHRVTDGDCTEGQRLEQEQKAYGDDLKWVKTLLEERFNFTEVVRFEAVRLRREGAGAGCWLDEVMFEHTCLFDPRDARVKEG